MKPNAPAASQHWLLLALFCCLAVPATAQNPPRPNFVVIFIDDLGYGDKNTVVNHGDLGTKPEAKLNSLDIDVQAAP